MTGGPPDQETGKAARFPFSHRVWFRTAVPALETLFRRPYNVPLATRALYAGRVTLAELQQVIEDTYGERDRSRGIPVSVAWLAEEVGELAQAIRKGSHTQREHEFADVIAWVLSLANQVGVDIDDVVHQRYGAGCPRCSAKPCACPM